MRERRESVRLVMRVPFEAMESTWSTDGRRRCVAAVASHRVGGKDRAAVPEVTAAMAAACCGRAAALPFGS
ncbi:hypothetical protein GCM10010515_49780 [Streptomyces fructofermentans]|uniref:Uncharacterized protein n=1 Tax=Streptomyces fructofermentans TaxID=152141 RepID=A0A918NJU8_9ACTN|nr:hypothetical protein GCM10010515_49780 [Streptomyces fructofermentans]